MNLTGRWKGKYTFGEGYPFDFIGKSDLFELEIVDNDGVISGSCIDPLVKAQQGNDSYILGSFNGNEIVFKKRYKFHFAIDEEGNYFMEEGVTHNGIDYSGRLYKKLFSRKPYFAGDWSITSEFKDDYGQTQVFMSRGTWEMKRVDN